MKNKGQYNIFFEATIRVILIKNEVSIIQRLLIINLKYPGCFSNLRLKPLRQSAIK
jgi:hypothetical protein